MLIRSADFQSCPEFLRPHHSFYDGLDFNWTIQTYWFTYFFFFSPFYFRFSAKFGMTDLLLTWSGSSSSCQTVVFIFTFHSQILFYTEQPAMTGSCPVPVGVELLQKSQNHHFGTWYEVCVGACVDLLCLIFSKTCHHTYWHNTSTLVSFALRTLLHWPSDLLRDNFANFPYMDLLSCPYRGRLAAAFNGYYLWIISLSVDWSTWDCLEMILEWFSDWWTVKTVSLTLLLMSLLFGIVSTSTSLVQIRKVAELVH